MLWPDCAYAQAGLNLCWLHIPHCWKSHVAAHMLWVFKWTVYKFMLKLIDKKIFTIWCWKYLLIWTYVFVQLLLTPWFAWYLQDQGVEFHEHEDYVEDALKLGVTPETMEVLISCMPTASREELVWCNNCHIKLIGVIVSRIFPEFRILRLTFRRKSASKYRIRPIIIYPTKKETHHYDFPI